MVKRLRQAPNEYGSRSSSSSRRRHSSSNVIHSGVFIMLKSSF